MQTSPIPASSGDALGSAVSGLLKAEKAANEAAGAIAGGISDHTVENILALNQAANDFAANAQVVNTVSETTKRLIDIFA
jgi:flagellar hook-basal body complex protein FliE